MDYRILKLNQVIRGWINYFRIGKMKQNMTKIDKHLRNRMRIVIWKQWKTNKKRMWGTKEARSTRMDGETIRRIYRPLSGGSQNSGTSQDNKRNPRKARTH